MLYACVQTFDVTFLTKNFWDLNKLPAQHQQGKIWWLEINYFLQAPSRHKLNKESWQVVAVYTVYVYEYISLLEWKLYICPYLRVKYNHLGV